MNIKNADSILAYCQQEGLSLPAVAILYEEKQGEQPSEIIQARMMNYWQTMKQAIYKGLDVDAPVTGGKIVGRESLKMKARYEKGQSVCGGPTAKAVAYALATMEVNISMGKIVAAPTAGACGVLPGTLLAVQEQFQLTDERMVDGLFVASLIGLVIARNASISGAKGGCQAEIGSAAAMAAGAITYMMGGSNEQVFEAGSIALQNLMGLVCDPVAGLVEVPCHKRNGVGAANALICAEMTLSGMACVIPFDQVVEAMKNVGDLMPACLRETSAGGIAVTKAAVALENVVLIS